MYLQFPEELMALLGEMSEGQLLKIDLPSTDLDSSKKRHRLYEILTKW